MFHLNSENDKLASRLNLVTTSFRKPSVNKPTPQICAPVGFHTYLQDSTNHTVF